MPRAARRAAVTGPAPRNDAMGASIEGAAAPSALVREPQLVVAEVEHVAFVDALVVDAHALVVDAVRRAEVFDVVGAVAADDGGVLAGNVAVLDREVGGLRAAPDDELVLVDRHLLVVEEQ